MLDERGSIDRSVTEEKSLSVTSRSSGAMMSRAWFPGEIKAYDLTFAPDIRFRFMASPEAAGALQLMVQVMGLKPASGTDSPVLFFTRSAPSCPHFSQTTVFSPFDMANETVTEAWGSVDFPFMRMWISTSTRHILCQLLYWDSVTSNIARIKGALNPVYLTLIQQGGLPIHGALIQFKDKGLLFLGQSGVGKSTACARMTGSFIPLSDDEALILKKGDGFYGHPIPTWSGFQNEQSVIASTHVEKEVEITALFFLKQGAETQITPMGRGEAAVRICQASLELLATYPLFSKTHGLQVRRKILFDTACDMAQKIPAHTLFLSLSHDFMGAVAETIRLIGEKEAS